MKQRTRVLLVFGIVVIIAAGAIYTVDAFQPPSTTRCIATDPPATFYVVLNENGTFSRVQ